MTAPLDEEALAAHLDSAWLGRPLRHLERCASTNDEAAAWARDPLAPAPAGAIVIAESQTKGRGRLGRTWHSPPRENLYFSTVLRPPLAPPAAPPLTLAAAVALAEAAEAEGATVELKWPNDLLLDGKKLAGILTEMSTSSSRIQFVIVGIGVNLNTRAFPAELAARATSLSAALARTIDRAAFTATLCAALERWHDRLVAEGPAPILAAWKERARLFGTRVTVHANGAPITGIAEDLDPDGALRLVADDGRRLRIIAGEIESAATE